MQRAIDAVHKGEIAWMKAAKMFGVPQAKRRRRARDKNKRAQ